MYFRVAAAFIVLLTSFVIFGISCTSDELADPRDVGDVSTETDDADGTDIDDADSTDVGDADSTDADVLVDTGNDAGSDADAQDDIGDTDYEREIPYPPCDDAEFEKPDPAPWGFIEEVPSFAPHEVGTPRMTTWGPNPRPHMGTTEDLWNQTTEIWIDPGEYYVLDHSAVQHNVWWLPSDYMVVVLLDGERLPFAIETIPDPQVTGDDDATFPAMDEIEDWPDENFDEVHTIHVESSIPLHYTLVIPPWAFPDVGGYNIQKYLFPVWEPTYELRELATHAGVGLHTMAHSGGLVATYTIYYGEYCLEDNTDAYPDRTDEAEEWDSTEPGRYAGRNNLQFLAPPLDVCDWAANEWPDEWSCLSHVLTFDEPEITLDLYTAGFAPVFASRTDTRGQNLYYVFRDDEVIDTFLFEPEEAEWADILLEDDKGVVLPIEVSLTEEPASYHILAVPQPFAAQISEPGLSSGINPVESNALLLRYDPE